MHLSEKVEFIRQKTTNYGEGLYIAGNIPALGEWNPKNALKLKWTEGNNWRGEIYVNDPCEFEYKYFISSYDGVKESFIKWDVGPNATLVVNSKLRIPRPHKEVKVMSFNIRYANKVDGQNGWENRWKTVAEIMKNSGADFIGVQEGLLKQLTDLQSLLPMYKWYGRGRDVGSDNGEASPIFYLHEFWEFKEGNTYWLSDMPQLEGSKSFGNDLPRICTWAKFVHKQTGIKILMANCHLDHENINAQKKGAQLIKKVFDLHGPETNLILTGDFNSTPYSETVNIMINEGPKLNDSASNKDNNGTFHGWSGNLNGDKIDYILTSDNLKCQKFEIIRTQVGNNRYPSDHFPIFAEFVPNK